MPKNDLKQLDKAQRQAPVIKTDAFQWQAEGFAWREAFVRLPAGMVAQDLGDHPEAWKNIQASAMSLKRFDRVVAVSHDESWLVNALVTDADQQRVLLDFGGKVVKLPPRQAQWESDEVVIKWSGRGYGVYRKSNGAKLLPQVFADVEMAKAEYHRTKQPQRVA